MLLDTFDLMAFLQEQGIGYKMSGTNISSGWVGIQCPFCRGKGYHCGVSRSSYGFNCWQCGRKGNIGELVKEILGVSKAEAWKKIRAYCGAEVMALPATPNQHASIAEFLASLPLRDAKLSKAAQDMLKARSFNLGAILRDFQVYTTKAPISFASRLIIPIEFNKEPVTFVGMAVNRKDKPKYLNCPADKSVIPVRQTIYGIDDAPKDIGILVEGPTDRWRLGKKSMALMGKSISPSQVDQIFRKNFKEVFIILDSGEEEAAERIAGELKAFTEVNIVSLTEGDPGDLTDQLAANLMKDILTSRHLI